MKRLDVIYKLIIMNEYMHNIYIKHRSKEYFALITKNEKFIDDEIKKLDYTSEDFDTKLDNIKDLLEKTLKPTEVESNQMSLFDDKLNPLVVVSVGSPENKPAEEKIEEYRKIFEEATTNKDFKIFTHDAVNIEVFNTEEKAFMESVQTDLLIADMFKKEDEKVFTESIKTDQLINELLREVKPINVKEIKAEEKAISQPVKEKKKKTKQVKNGLVKI